MPEKRTFQGVSITFDPHWARIVTDRALFGYLDQAGKKDASRLAEYIRAEYQGIYGTPLEISTDSLAVEILIHVCVDRIAQALQDPKLPPSLRSALKPAVERIRRSTSVIDCGEKAVDGNRFVFDRLEPFAPLIAALLEK